MSDPRSDKLFGNPKEVARFVVAGGTGSAIFLGLDQLVYYRDWSPFKGNETTSWLVGYLTSSFVTHSLHRYITFYHRPTDYWRTLRRTYVIYGLSVALTAGLITALESGLGIVHELAWLMTLSVSGTLNYLAFRHWGFRTQVDAARHLP